MKYTIEPNNQLHTPIIVYKRTEETIIFLNSQFKTQFMINETALDECFTDVMTYCESQFPEINDEIIRITIEVSDAQNVQIKTHCNKSIMQPTQCHNIIKKLLDPFLIAGGLSPTKSR